MHIGRSLSLMCVYFASRYTPTICQSAPFSSEIVRPIGFLPGKYWRANISFNTTTLGAPASSVARSSRPSTRGIPSVVKSVSLTIARLTVEGITSDVMDYGYICERLTLTKAGNTQQGMASQPVLSENSHGLFYATFSDSTGYKIACGLLA